VALFLFACSILPGAVQACQPGNAGTPREALDCSVALIEKTDTKGACKTFILGYERFVRSGRINEFPLIDIERFLFEGGERLLSYSWKARKREDKIDAAAHAETFFTSYMTWFNRLDDKQKKTLPDTGRIRAVVSFLGNALIAQERMNELPDYYISNVGEATLFGPDAIDLWQKSLRQVYGEPQKGSSSDKGHIQWKEFAEFVKEWADVPGLLPKYLRNRFMNQATRILGEVT
jgi:hypothetical protein